MKTGGFTVCVDYLVLFFPNIKPYSIFMNKAYLSILLYKLLCINPKYKIIKYILNYKCTFLGSNGMHFSRSSIM